MYTSRIKKYIKSLRSFRVWHRYLGVSLALLLLISAVTGMLLSLKKEIDFLQPPTQKGKAETLQEWKPLHELSAIASAHFYENFPDQKNNPIDRFDVRPGKGVVKVLFENGTWEVQIDGATGAVLSVGKRHSDWIESLHDGSIISQLFKLISMNVLGIGLIVLLSTGIWLWYGPGLVRSEKKKRRSQ